MKVYVVSSEANGDRLSRFRPEAAFTDEEQAYRYSTMGDMIVDAVELDPE